MSRLSPIRSRLTAGPGMSVSIAVAAVVAGAGAYALYSRSKTPPKETFSSFGFTSLLLRDSELINHNTKRLRFELPERDSTSGLKLSSALLSITFPKGPFPVLRPYTPVNDLDTQGYIELMIKHYPGGKASTHMHSLKPGDWVTFAPIPALAYKPNQHAHVAMVAGGAGITPMLQLARGILKNPDDHTRVTLIWGVNTDEDIFLADELAAFEKRYPGRFRAIYTVSNPKPDSPYSKGYVTRKVLESAGVTPGGTGEKAAAPDEIKVLVCGPPAMEKALVGSKSWGAKSPGVLQEMGFASEQIHKF